MYEGICDEDERIVYFLGAAISDSIQQGYVYKDRAAPATATNASDRGVYREQLHFTSSHILQRIIA